MRKLQFITTAILGAFSILVEYQSLKENTVFGTELIQSVPLTLLCILTIVYLFKSVNQYAKIKNAYAFIPFLLGVFFLLITFGHMIVRSNLDNSPTLFFATTNNIGNDGGFKLDFKKNNHLKGVKIDRFSTTFYWGSYIKLNDTIKIDLPTDFKLGKIAFLQKDTLHFVNDTIHFAIYKP